MASSSSSLNSFKEADAAQEAMPKKKHGIRKDAVFFYWVRVFGNGISQPEDDR